jgi:hypothetical protein
VAEPLAEPLAVRIAGKGAAFFDVPGGSLSGEEKCICDECAWGLRGVASMSAAALTASADVEPEVCEANGMPRLLPEVAEFGLSDVAQGRAGLLVALAGEAPMNGWWLCECAGPVAGKTPK